MEKIINIHIKKLPEGLYLATSKDIQGLVAQGRTAIETLEIARDVARKLIEAQAERSGELKLSTLDESFDYPLIQMNFLKSKNHGFSFGREPTTFYCRDR